MVVGGYCFEVYDLRIRHTHQTWRLRPRVMVKNFFFQKEIFHSSPLWGEWKKHGAANAAGFGWRNGG
jgi:hypothetical protein